MTMVVCGSKVEGEGVRVRVRVRVRVWLRVGCG